MMEHILFLSPHNDDETLFGAFTLQKEIEQENHPHVFVCYRSDLQEQRGGLDHRVREMETNLALQELGVRDYVQGTTLDTAPQEDVEPELIRLIHSLPPIARVYAPADEGEQGNQQHNYIARLADSLFLNVTHYMTYTWPEGRSRGSVVVEAKPQWIERKLLAMARYRSQMREPSTTVHFLYPQFEYYA